MNLKQMKGRCPAAKLIGRAYLARYRLAFTKMSPVWRCGVADIIQDDKHQVWGLLYEVREKDLEQLDSCEGYPDFYKRIEVTVIDEQGKSQEAITYEILKKESFTPPSPRYLNILRETAKIHSFPHNYRQFLEAIKTGLDKVI